MEPGHVAGHVVAGDLPALHGPGKRGRVARDHTTVLS